MVLKRIILPLIILILVGGTAFWVLTIERDTTLDVESTNFSVKDTAAIDMIELSNMKGGSVTLKRDNNENWIVNDEYQANGNKIQTLLTTIKEVEVKSPVPLNSRKNVIKSLAAKNIQIDIHKDGDLVRSYFVGHQTPGEMGTYMAMNNEEKKPYITHIPGFYGYLTPRYFVNPEKWRTKKIFSFNPVAIQEVAVRYTNNPEASFNLNIQGSGQFSISNPETGESLKKTPAKPVKKYLVRFKDILCESALKGDKNQVMLDSLQNMQPNVVIEASDKQKSRKVAFYDAGLYPEGDKVSDATKAKRYYVMASHRPKDVLVVQRMVVEPILKSYQDFDSEKMN